MRTDGKEMRLQMGADLKVTITCVNTFIVYVKNQLYANQLYAELLNGLIFDSAYES